MTESPGLYTVTPTVPGVQPEVEPEVKPTYNWQKRMLKKATEMRAAGETCALVVVFFKDGCVSFFQADASGRECP